MRKHNLKMAAAGAILATAAFSQTADAHLLINIDKSAQRMVVSMDGQLLYVWPVSTGGRGYDTPNGSYRPFRMDIDHRSEEYDNAPMPYSIFFTGSGIAVHGTNEADRLGQAASHGCVRLSVYNAETLWTLVQDQKMANTTVVVNGSTGADRPVVAQSDPMVVAPQAGYGQPLPPMRERQPGLFASLFGG
jgi:lipoprotein-anchoring transpeptidase ErfK/SrfK